MRVATPGASMVVKQFVISLAMFVAVTNAAAAQSRIGTAVRVINNVTADQSPIVTGDGVSQNQTVEVAPDSLGELKLDDDTKLALGPGAKLVLDTFVYDSANSTGSVAVNLAKGAFRFVTGSAQKKDYKIKTPGASITVRGTVLDIYIAPNGAEWILLHEGAIEVCNVRNVCRTVESACQAIGLTAAGQVGEPGGWVTRTGSSDIDFDVAFPFVKSPPLADFKFYHTRAEVEANQCPDPNAPFKSQRAENDAPLDPAPDYDPGAPAGPSGPSPVKVASVPNDSPAVEPPVDVPLDVPAGLSIYVGLQGGRGWSDNQKTEIACDDPNNYFDVQGGSCAGPGAQLQLYETDSDGFTGGGYAGVNVRAGVFVFGAETDLSFANIDSSAPVNANGVNFPIGGSDISQQINWMGTARGRAGLMFNNVMVFTTGGLAVAGVDYAYKLNSNFGPLVTAAAPASETKVGWTAGGGFEVGLGLWSLKTEYLYYDLGEQTLDSDVFFSGTTTGATVNTAISLSPKFETEGHIVRMGLSLHLN